MMKWMKWADVSSLESKNTSCPALRILRPRPKERQTPRSRGRSDGRCNVPPVLPQVPWWLRWATYGQSEINAKSSKPWGCKLMQTKNWEISTMWVCTITTVYIVYTSIFLKEFSSLPRSIRLSSGAWLSSAATEIFLRDLALLMRWLRSAGGPGGTKRITFNCSGEAVAVRWLEGRLQCLGGRIGHEILRHPLGEWFQCGC